jgi:hypothetical protein
MCDCEPMTVDDLAREDMRYPDGAVLTEVLTDCNPEWTTRLMTYGAGRWAVESSLPCDGDGA